MENQNLHQQLTEASRQIKEAQEAVIQAQGTNPDLIKQAHDKLQQAEQVLESAQKAGKEATENPQFQQAYEALHDTRQQVQEAHQNNNDLL